MSNNTLLQAVVLTILAAHGAVLIVLGQSTRGPGALLLLNAAMACAVLLYAGSRARYILAGPDWPYLVLVVFELLVLAVAFWANRGSRGAMIGSCVIFGLHACASLAATGFAFVFKMTRMM